MKYLKKFNESNFQIFDSNEAREVLSKIYDIKDEIKMSYSSDFLVEIDDFLEKMHKSENGSFADNKFYEIDDFKNYLTEVVEGLIVEFSDLPIYYVAPYWRSRTEKELINLEEVYSDTIYIPINDDVHINDDLLLELEDSLKVDELFVMKSIKGKNYLRLWWD